MHVSTSPTFARGSIAPSSLGSMSDSEDWSTFEIVESESDVFSESKSRRSSISIPSDSDGHIDAWEGLADTLTDDEGSIDALLCGNRDPAPAAEDSPSDVEVKAALDQSFIGTLSTSKSTQSSSTRDLGLSFPDPLSSSFSAPNLPGTLRLQSQKLKALSPRVTPDSGSQTSNSTSSPGSAVLVQAHDASSLELPGPASPTVPSRIPEDAPQPRVLFEVFLYGSLSPMRWSVVSNLLRKTNFGPGRGIISVSHNPESHSRIWHIEMADGDIACVPVYDRTDSSQSEAPSSHYPVHPSLAFVCLPFSNSSFIGNHDFYLPVIVTLDHDSAQEQHGVALEWQYLNIPSDKHLSLSWTGDNDIITDEELAQLSGALVDDAMQPLIRGSDLPPQHGQQTDYGIETEQDATTQLMGLLSLSMLVMFAACFLSIFFGSDMAPTKTAETKGAWSVVRPQNVVVSKATVSETALTTPFHDYLRNVKAGNVFGKPQQSSERLALYSSLQATSQQAQPLSKVTDVMVRPPSNVAVTVNENAEAGPSSLPPPSSSVVPPITTKALSFHIIDSVSKVYDLDVHGLIQSVQDDIQDINEALDGLMNAISDTVRHASLQLAENVGEGIQYRHNRAKSRAKELLARGERWVSLSAPALARCARDPLADIQQRLAKGHRRAHHRAQRLTVETTKWLGLAWSNSKGSDSD